MPQARTVIVLSIILIQHSGISILGKSKVNVRIIIIKKEDVKYRPVPKGYTGVFRLREDMTSLNNEFYGAWGIIDDKFLIDEDYYNEENEFKGDPDHVIRASFYPSLLDLQRGENLIREVGRVSGTEKYCYIPFKRKNNYY